MIVWFELITRLELRFLVARTRLESRWSKWWLGSTRVTFFHRMTRLESQSVTRDSSQSHFYNVSEFLIDKPTSCALKEMSIFCFSDDQDWRKILCYACLVVLCYILRIKRPNLHRGRPETFFLWGDSRAQYIDTLSWFNAVCEYCHPVSGSHTVTWVFSRYQVKWFKFFRFKSSPKPILQNITQIRKLNFV